MPGTGAARNFLTVFLDSGAGIRYSYVCAHTGNHPSLCAVSTPRDYADLKRSFGLPGLGGRFAVLVLYSVRGGGAGERATTQEGERKYVNPRAKKQDERHATAPGAACQGTLPAPAGPLPALSGK